jgi:hypothetical protein
MVEVRAGNIEMQPIEKALPEAVQRAARDGTPLTLLLFRPGAMGPGGIPAPSTSDVEDLAAALSASLEPGHDLLDAGQGHVGVVLEGRSRRTAVRAASRAAACGAPTFTWVGARYPRDARTARGLTQVAARRLRGAITASAKRSRLLPSRPRRNRQDLGLDQPAEALTGTGTDVLGDESTALVVGPSNLEIHDDDIEQIGDEPAELIGSPSIDEIWDEGTEPICDAPTELIGSPSAQEIHDVGIEPIGDTPTGIILSASNEEIDEPTEEMRDERIESIGQGRDESAKPVLRRSRKARFFWLTAAVLGALAVALFVIHSPTDSAGRSSDQLGQGENGVGANGSDPSMFGTVSGNGSGHSPSGSALANSALGGNSTSSGKASKGSSSDGKGSTRSSSGSTKGQSGGSASKSSGSSGSGRPAAGASLEASGPTSSGGSSGSGTQGGSSATGGGTSGTGGGSSTGGGSTAGSGGGASSGGSSGTGGGSSGSGSSSSSGGGSTVSSGGGSSSSGGGSSSSGGGSSSSGGGSSGSGGSSSSGGGSSSSGGGGSTTTTTTTIPCIKLLSGVCQILGGL